MQNFEYLKPTTIEQAVAVLYREGEQAKALSGGTDLIVQLREGRRSAAPPPPRSRGRDGRPRRR